MAVLSERDARTWQALAARIAAALRPTLPPNVMANRTVAEASDPRKLGPSLRRARRAGARMAASSEAVIVTDIRSFYPSVTPSAAFDALDRLDPDTETAREAANMLEGWGSEGYAGLPIGPPGSAILANAILAFADAELAGFRFLRWVDDYAIVLRRARRAAEALERLDVALERWGLQRSEPKTRLVAGGGRFAWPGTYAALKPSE